MYDCLKNKTALYVESELDVLKNIHESLRSFFKDFYTARDSEKGYNILAEKVIDVLFVDVELPKLNGIDLIKRIRKTNKDIAIIVISAYTKKDYLLEFIELKLEKYIVKPLTSKKMHLMLTKLDERFSEENTKLIADNVLLNVNTAMVSFDGKKFNLTKKELQILQVLVRKKSISYDEIYALWEDKVPSQNAIRSCFKKLRKKLPNKFIKNRNGVGYYLNTQFSS